MPAGDIDLNQFKRPRGAKRTRLMLPSAGSRGFLVKASAQGYCALAIRPVPEPLKLVNSLRYVSTRGEAPALDFVEVMLAGLARDGGLYVPESWPALESTAIAGFAGRPYAEVAVGGIRPF